MARNDIYLNINSLSVADAVVTGQQDMTAATIPELVLGDTPTFNFYFTDNTNVWPSWAGNASYSLTWALSNAVSGDFAPAATTGNATPITGGWSVVLPLNSYDLVGLLNTKRIGQSYPVQNLWQQLRVTDPSGNEVTRAMVWTPVRYRAISDTQNTESASPTGGRFVTVNNVNTLTTPTAAQFYAANPVPTSALGTAANGELLIGNGTGFTKATLTAGSGVSITNSSGSITITATDGDITLDDGTAAAPSLKFTADTDTGLFRPSDNVVGISAGGVSRATFGATSAINGTSIPASKTLVVTTDKLSALASTSSSELAGVISDETGTGSLVFANTPTLVTPNIGAATGTSVNLTGAGTFGGNLTVSGSSTANLISLRSTSTSGYAETSFFDSANNKVGAVGFGNSATASPYTSAMYFNTLFSTVPIVFAPNGTAALTLSGTGGNATLAGNLTVSGGTVGAAASTNLTLSGGSSGASLVLGQGTSGSFTFTLPNISAGSTTWVSAGAVGIGIDFKRTTATATLGGTLASLNGYNGATRSTIFEFNGDGATDSGRFDWWVKPTAGSLTQVMTLKSSGNLLIGTTTDGGQKLQVNGTAFASRYDVGYNDNPTGTSPKIFASAASGSTIDVLLAGGGSRSGNIQYYNDGGGTSQFKFGTSVPSSTTEHVRFNMPTSGLGSSVVSIYGTTASTSTSSGALQVSGGVGVAGAINVGTFYGMVDGVTAPSATSGYAKIYVDTADGDLKVIFGDGTIKTIATDS